MDYDALAARVEEDAADFGAWSKLLAVVEETSVAHPERVASTFEAFLAKFPLCFGYWCKYAELKQKLGEAGAVDASDGGAAEVYARALEAVPLSVELWKAYTAHVKATTAGQASDQLRAAYVRATEMVGHDSAAAGLWDAFMEFEADRGDPESVCTVFRNMLRVDTSGRTDELWKRLKMLCKSYRCNEICSDAERLELLERYNVAKKTGTSAAEDIEASSSGRVAGMKELQEQRQMEQLLTEAEKAKNDLINSRLQRQHYEAGVRRWYFHVKPLDDAQLNNWRDYLTLEADRPPAGGDAAAHVAKVRGLFERCLVPCALYSEFWIRYVSWARTHCGATDALAVATRAATVFLPRRPDVLGVLAARAPSKRAAGPTTRGASTRPSTPRRRRPRRRPRARSCSRTSSAARAARTASTRSTRARSPTARRRTSSAPTRRATTASSGATSTARARSSTRPSPRRRATRSSGTPRPRSRRAASPTTRTATSTAPSPPSTRPRSRTTARCRSRTAATSGRSTAPAPTTSATTPATCSRSPGPTRAGARAPTSRPRPSRPRRSGSGSPRRRRPRRPPRRRRRPRSRPRRSSSTPTAPTPPTAPSRVHVTRP